MIIISLDERLLLWLKKPVHRVQMTEGKRNIIHQLS